MRVVYAALIAALWLPAQAGAQLSDDDEAFFEFLGSFGDEDDNFLDPVALETELNQIVGVVTNGLFAARPADVLLLGGDAGVRTLDGSAA